MTFLHPAYCGKENAEIKFHKTTFPHSTFRIPQVAERFTMLNFDLLMKISKYKNDNIQAITNLADLTS